ncbi:MAG: helix-turn-helix domain-containing protein [Candidatus Omnitrophota bacterium]|nr:helix-turn-helix domain-containing protein [Candidatus Omnitrophota bacterium]
MKRQFYTTKDVLKVVGISRNTLFLWFWHKKIPEVKRDRNGHRIFSKEDIAAILNYKNHTVLPAVR